MSTNKPAIRRTDRASDDAPDSQRSKLRRPIAGESRLAEAITGMVREGDLYEKLPENRVHCYACGHHCKINDGGRGICQVRYNVGGKLYVPRGYVAALQCDPIEKKPFFHVYPGSDALTFGMLGCDLHCGYCFHPETIVITDRGPLQLVEAFESAPRVETRPDAEIAYPDGLCAVAASGTLRRVEAVFKHPYRGPLTVIQPYYLPALRCTPDHRIYATDDVTHAPEPVQARQLTDRHYLAVPRHISIPILQPMAVAGLANERQVGRDHPAPTLWELSAASGVIETEDYYLVPLREITSVEYDGAVYNMQVEEEHNYLAEFFLVSNCQNWDISQALRDASAGRPPSLVTPQKMVELGRRNGAQVFASSYNEPLITSEWAVEIFKEATAQGFTCAYVSNGNATREVLEYIRPYVSAYKIDLKSMRDRNYRQLGAPLQNILDGIRLVQQLGFWLEIVTLVVPGFNDSMEELRDAAQFIASISRDIPWHVTAFHSDYKMQDHDNTSVATLLRACELGRAAGLNYVYAGNIPGHTGGWENTYCPNCHALLIGRYGYTILEYHLTAEGTCYHCGCKIAGLFPQDPGRVHIGSDEFWYARRPRPAR